MAEWGGVGGFWGIPGVSSGALWLYINRDVPLIAALGRIVEDRSLALQGLLRRMSTAFDLTDAVGDQLDIVGAGLSLPRLGLEDARYRRALRVQREIVLGSQGRRSDMLAVWSEWTGAEATEYRTIHPLQIEIAGVVEPADEALLVTFLRRAVPGGRVLGVYSAPADALRVDYTQDPIGGTGTIDYTQDPVDGAAPLAARIS